MAANDTTSSHPTSAGRWAGWLALTTIGAFAASIVLAIVAEPLKPVIAIFWLSGVGTLVLSAVGLRAGDRSLTVRASFALGLLMAAFLLVELIFPE